MSLELLTAGKHPVLGRARVFVAHVYTFQECLVGGSSESRLQSCPCTCRWKSPTTGVDELRRHPEPEHQAVIAVLALAASRIACPAALASAVPCTARLASLSCADSIFPAPVRAMFLPPGISSQPVTWASIGGCEAQEQGCTIHLSDL